MQAGRKTPSRAGITSRCGLRRSAEPLAQAGICPHEEELRRQWESAAAPVLADSGLVVPETVQPIYGGRVGRHPEPLAKLLEDLQLVHSIDPSAKW